MQWTHPPLKGGGGTPLVHLGIGSLILSTAAHMTSSHSEQVLACDPKPLTEVPFTEIPHLRSVKGFHSAGHSWSSSLSGTKWEFLETKGDLTHDACF